MKKDAKQKIKSRREKYRVFYYLEEHLEIPMFLLAIIWLFFFVKELVHGLTGVEQKILTGVWILFITEFCLKLFLSPKRLSFLKRNWISIAALLIPFLRVFRLFRALRILNSVRVVSSTKIIRAVTSGRRFMHALQEAQGPVPEAAMDVGILTAYAKPKNAENLKILAQSLRKDVEKELNFSSGIPWTFEIADEIKLEKDETRRPSDFLDAASQRMAEGPYDVILVLTDVALGSKKKILVAGASSSVSRIMVISTRKLSATTKGETNLSIAGSRVRMNTATLFLKLCGYMFGLNDKTVDSTGIMNIRDFGGDLKEIPGFNEEERRSFKNKAARIPDRELRRGTWLEMLVFHILMTGRHFKSFVKSLFKNKSFFLSLSLPGLATAAVAPGFILVFTAEIWDVGLGMTNKVAISFAIISILLASFYLVNVQSLFLPRQEKRILTEHLAVANSIIYCSILLAFIGLFLMLILLMLILELYVFPSDLMQTWPSLETGIIDFTDQLRLAAFISTVSVITGALAGGLDKRTVIQHLSLFDDHI